MNFVEKKIEGIPVLELEGKVMGGLSSLALQFEQTKPGCARKQ